MTGQLEIAERISSISVSSTMRVAAEAEKLRSQGVDVVDFGEPGAKRIRRQECDVERLRAMFGAVQHF